MAQRDHLARPGHRPGTAALRREMAECVLVEHDPGQRQRVPFAAARVRIGFPDQGPDVLAAVSGHRRRMQPGRRHHVPVHDEDPVVGARNILLDHDLGAAGAGPLVRLGRLDRGRHPHRHVRPMVAVAGFDHQGRPQRVQGRRGASRRPGDHPGGHRYSRDGQQFLGQDLVGGDVHAHGRGLLGEGRPQQPAVAAVAEAEQAEAPGPPDRDAALAGRRGQGGGADPEAGRGHLPGDRFEGVPQRRRALGEGLGDHPHGQREQVLWHRGGVRLVLGALHDHVIAALGAGPDRPPESHLAAGQGGQFERHMLGHVTEVGPAGQRGEEAAGTPRGAVVPGQPRQRAGQPGVEAGAVRRLLPGQPVQFQPGHRDRAGRVDVRARQAMAVDEAHGAPSVGSSAGGLVAGWPGGQPRFQQTERGVGLSSGCARARCPGPARRCRIRTRPASGAAGRRTR